MAVTRIRIEIDDENGSHAWQTTHGAVITQALGDSRAISVVLGQIKEEAEPYPPA